MEDDDEVLSCSSDSDSGEEYAGECEKGLDEEGDELEADCLSPPDDERKSQNVDALVRYLRTYFCQRVIITLQHLI